MSVKIKTKTMELTYVKGIQYLLLDERYWLSGRDNGPGNWNYLEDMGSTRRRRVALDTLQATDEIVEMLVHQGRDRMLHRGLVDGELLLQDVSLFSERVVLGRDDSQSCTTRA